MEIVKPGKTGPGLPAVLTAVLVVLLLAAIVEFSILYRLHAVNRRILSPHTIEAAEGLRVHLAFARAWHLQSRGEVQQALQLYNEVENRAGSAMKQNVQYNMGTLYLEQAARHWNSHGVRAYSEVTTWTGLAERSFRQVLKHDPGHWDARYNLEYTLRLKPPPREVEKADWSGHKSSVHSIYPGIPGGSP